MKTDYFDRPVTGYDVFCALRDNHNSFPLVLSPSSHQARLGSKWELHIRTDTLTKFLVQANQTMEDFEEAMVQTLKVEGFETGTAMGPMPLLPDIMQRPGIDVCKFDIRNNLKTFEVEDAEALIQGIFENWGVSLP